MRKLFLSLLAFFLFVSNVYADVVEESAAQQVANAVFAASNLRAGAPVRRARTSSTEVSAPAYYIFKGAEGKGFVVVSAEDATQPILGYSMTADVNEIPSGMEYWLDDMEKQINVLRENNEQPSEEIRNLWTAAALGSYVVKLTTAEWNQTDPFNYYCPTINGKKAYTGCVATAYAIVMRYYSYPASSKGSIPAYYTETENNYVAGRNLNHTIEWNNMPLSYKSFTQAQKLAVSTLMADIGAAVSMDYKASESSANYGKPAIITCFDYASGEYLSKDAYSTSVWNQKLHKELDEGRPILYRGENPSGGGHAFVLDGYTTDNYYSVNWGWGGSYNGNFLLTALTPYSGRNYVSNQGAIFGFMPLDSDNLDACAVVGSTKCPDIQTALALSNTSGQAVKLLKDIEIDKIRIESDETVSIDLNGHSINVGNSIWNYGKLTVDDQTNNGLIKVTSNNAVISNYGTLTVNGGQYLNAASSYTENDYRRVIWTKEDTYTTINGGQFTNLYGSSVLVLNGSATINDGVFSISSNTSVVNNYNQKGNLIINGGEFYNNCASKGEKDYRRNIWTQEGTNTIISGGKFVNDYGEQSLCFNGNAKISNAEISAPNGWDVLAYSSSQVVISNSRLGGKYPVYANTSTGAKITVHSGIFSKEIASTYLSGNSYSTANTDSDTKQKYPYRVVDTSVTACAAPTITYKDGHLLIKSSTKGAKCFYTITAEGTTSTGDVTLENTYKVTAYATADGYSNSNVTTAVIKMSAGVSGDLNSDGEVSVTDVTKLVNIILGK